MHDEETGEEIQCPYCEATEGCEHLVALIDKTFGEVLGGQFFERRDDFVELVEKTLLAALQAGTKRLDKAADPNLQALWIIAAEDFKPGNTALSTDSGPLTQLQVDLFRKAGGKEPEGCPVLEGGPGQSSALAVFYSDQPKRVVSEVFTLLNARLQPIASIDPSRKHS